MRNEKASMFDCHLRFSMIMMMFSNSVDVNDELRTKQNKTTYTTQSQRTHKKKAMTISIRLDKMYRNKLKMQETNNQNNEYDVSEGVESSKLTHEQFVQRVFANRCDAILIYRAFDRSSQSDGFLFINDCEVNVTK